jgi:hypothetical protein
MTVPTAMHIDLGHVLRGTVCELYSNLVTRPTGVAVRTAIERQVREAEGPVVTTIDFSQVQLLDFSCADEIVAKLLLLAQRDDAPVGFLTFRGLQDGHLDPIETVLERHALALVSWHEGEAELFGAVTEAERRCWEAVRRHGPVTVMQLAQHLESSATALTRELSQLVQRRLIMERESWYSVPGAVGESPRRPRSVS